MNSKADTAQTDRLRLWLQLARTALPLSRDMDNRFRAQFDQSLVRFDVMSQLHRVPEGLPIGRLAEMMVAATSGNITMLLQRMEGEGLIARHTHPADARAAIIHLTPHGSDLFGAMSAAQKRWIGELMNDLPEDLVATLTGDLMRLRADLPQLGPAIGGGEPKQS